jgi:hypothetical protein
MLILAVISVEELTAWLLIVMPLQSIAIRVYGSLKTGLELLTVMSSVWPCSTLPGVMLHTMLVVVLEVVGGTLVVELLLVVGKLVVVLTGGTVLVVELLLVVGKLDVVLPGGGACVMLNAVSPMKVISGGLGGIWNM